MTKSNRIVNGYRLIYRPEWPSSMEGDNWGGYVYEHIYVVEKSLGRPLDKTECVHHLDCNRSNNNLNNLLVILRSEHGKLHAWLDRCDSIGKPVDANRMNSVNSEVPRCKVCELTLQGSQLVYCSTECQAKGYTKINKPTKEELVLAMSEERSWLALGRRYSVSDNAVRKWARGYGLTTTLSQAKGKPLEGAETTGEVE